jgi:hypothetical protein
VAAIFIAAVLVISSLAVAAFGRWGIGLSLKLLSVAVRRMLEFLGLWLLCLGVNVGLGTLAVLTFRSITARFVSVYLVNDVSFVIFSAIQASIVHAWLSSSDGLEEAHSSIER